MSLAGLAHQVEPYVQKFVDIDYSDQPSKDAAVYAKVEGGGRGGNSSGVLMELPQPIRVKQGDGTTHVCDPSFGGCNQGFELTRHTQVA